MTYASLLRTPCVVAVAIGCASSASAASHTLICAAHYEPVPILGGNKARFIVETKNPKTYVVQNKAKVSGKSKATVMTSPTIPAGAKIIVTRRVTPQQSSAAATLRFTSIHGMGPGASETFPTVQFNGGCRAHAEW